jgi:uncharacterized protein YjiS (DUF1127 family)
VNMSTERSLAAAPARARLGVLVDGIAVGAAPFCPAHHGAGFEEETEAPETPTSIATALRRTAGDVLARFGRYIRRRGEVTRATVVLSEFDERTLRDIGISRAEIDYAVRHGRVCEQWR